MISGFPNPLFFGNIQVMFHFYDSNWPQDFTRKLMPWNLWNNLSWEFPTKILDAQSPYSCWLNHLSNQKMRRSNWTCSPNRSENKTIWNHHLVFIWMNKHILSDQARSVIFGASKSLGCWNTSPCRIQVPGFLKPRQLGKSNAGWVCLFCLFCWWICLFNKNLEVFLVDHVKFTSYQHVW